MKHKTKRQNENVITLPEDVTIDLGDREVILEKGDKVRVLNEEDLVDDLDGDYSLSLDEWYVHVEIDPDYHDIDSIRKTLNKTIGWDNYNDTPTSTGFVQFSFVPRDWERLKGLLAPIAEVIEGYHY